MRNFSPQRSAARAYARGLKAALRKPQDAPQTKSAVETLTDSKTPHGEAHANESGHSNHSTTPTKST